MGLTYAMGDITLGYEMDKLKMVTAANLTTSILQLVQHTQLLQVSLLFDNV